MRLKWEEQKENGRRLNIETLRAFACMMVVLLHLNAWVYDVSRLSEFYKILFSIINTVTRFAVPCFMLITGSFIFNNARRKGYCEFYKSAIKKIVFPTIFFSMAYVVYRIVKESISGEIFVNEIVIDWLKGIPFGHMWYMYMLMGFYVVVPLLCFLRRKVGRVLWGICGCGCIILASILYSGSLIAPIWPLCWIQYVGYFILGDLMQGQNRTKRLRSIYAFLILLTALIMTKYSLSCLENGTIFDFQPQNLLTCIFSVSVYGFVLNSKGIKNNLVKLISEHSGYIYFLHGGAVNIVQIFMNKFNWQYSHPLLVLVTTYWMVLIGCVVISVSIKKYNKYCCLESEEDSG